MGVEPYERRLALVINPSDSRCGACGQPAKYTEDAHETKLGYRPSQGCGQRWLFVTSDYADRGGLYDGIREMRPDLVAHFPYAIHPRPTELDASG